MIVSLISAVAKNGVIGTGDGGIPWELPRDSRHFREYTSGKWMLLGRKTFQEMDGWFKDQTPVVLTRSSDFEVESGHRAESVEHAIQLAIEHGANELVVSGGARIYELALPLVEKLVLTRIDAEIDGKTLFPAVNWDNWQLQESTEWPPDEENKYKMTLEIFVPRAFATL